LTTIDALLSLADFLASPQRVARVKELQEAEKSALLAQNAAKQEADRAQALLDEHAEKEKVHAAAVAQFEADVAALDGQRLLIARKLAKMKEAEAI